MSKITWIRGAIAFSLAVVTFITSSMVALAAPGNQPAAELIVSGTATSDAPFTIVNGERAYSSRALPSSTVITTPETSSAAINLGKLGTVELAPNSSLNLNYSEAGISCTLNAGRVTLSGAANASVNTRFGSVVADKAQANAFTVNVDAAKTSVATGLGTVLLTSAKGKSIQVAAGQTGTSDDDDDDIIPGSVTLYAIVLGAAAAVLIYIAARDNNEFNFGGSTSVVSPTR